MTFRGRRSRIREANYDGRCLGIVAWCHTFSPSKMWLSGLAQLQKPYCHLATQYHREIPNEEIDMDFPPRTKIHRFFYP